MAELEGGGARRKGVTLIKSVVYGNIARYFGKKREEDGHTHSWMCYLRPFKNEDLSVYIRKVQFKLHESYPNPTRIFTKPPYEVSETGWGEFEVVIKVFFLDSSEKPLTIYHLLKLFDHQNDPAIVSGKKNVVSEHYDEIVFTDPTNTMFHLLNNSKAMLPSIRHEPGMDFIRQQINLVIPHTLDKETEERTLSTISSAHKKIKMEIHDLSERLKNSKELIIKLKEQIEKAEEDVNS